MDYGAEAGPSSSGASAEEDIVPPKAKKQRSESTPDRKVAEGCETLQFFVKLDGKTIVCRENPDTVLKDLKVSLLAERIGDTTRLKASSLAANTTFTCEGKRLHEALSLRHVPAGATLHLCHLLGQDQLYTRGSISAINLCKLVDNLLESRREASNELVESIPKELHAFLKPQLECAGAATYAQRFIKDGGVEAITKLVSSDFLFLATSCLAMVTEHTALSELAAFPQEVIFTKNAALILWWNLFESILEKYLKATGKLSESKAVYAGGVDDMFEQALLTLLNMPAATLETWQTTIPSRRSSNHLRQTLGGALCSVVQKALAHVRDNVAAFKTGGLQRGPLSSPFTLYPKLLERCRSFGLLSGPWGEYSNDGLKEHDQYKTLEAATAQILEDLYQTARGIDRAARVSASLASSLPQPPAPDGSLVATLSALGRLPPPLLIRLANLLNWMYDFEAGEEHSQKGLMAFLQSNQQIFNALLHLRVGEFEGVHDLGFLLVRPYTFLWPFETKERLLLTPNLCIPATRNAIASYEVRVKRDNLLTDAFAGLSAIDAQAVRQFGIDVAFDQEEGHGPGVMREFLTLVSQELFNPERALFLASPIDRRCVFPNHASGINPGHLSYFRFCGQIIILALANKVPLGVTFGTALLYALGDETGTTTGRYELAEDVDPELYDACEKILAMEDDEVENLGLTFVCTIDSGLGDHTEVELLPGGRNRALTAENRQLFVDLKVQKQVMEPVAEQIKALREGMESLLPEGVSWAHVFAPLTDQEFASQLQGATSDLDIDDWERHTTYHGCEASDDVIRYFWAAVRSLSPEQQRNLLFFATAIRYLPSTGFASLHDRVHIHCVETSVESLPTAHTCFLQLLLPRYTSYETMRERLVAVAQRHVAEGYGNA
ncbi:ubiquitin-protein ligase [Klebsormidium nitens]|uniref:HECT-type E3 ubiquitin transferase n=1 Tax=Klebsormidium nitens TaxID=105231 RepID=A0A1Y1HN75_KLENI|nr:ubiquitin-protein ligase [Klebsormidium nitens]|eukprot:GAQ78056.1 ubiquitin-protein ligase [Klebsormidium nitens]